MKKRILALLMAACMVIGLAGCGNGGGNGASEGSGEAADAETVEDVGSAEDTGKTEEAGGKKGDITLTLAMCGDGTTKEA